MSSRHIYKGYALEDDTTRTDDGRYRARAILVTIADGRARSQRFLDLETFTKEGDARQRAIAAARAWVDEEDAGGKLTLPIGLFPLY